jgi:hypothetical protein
MNPLSILLVRWSYLGPDIISGLRLLTAITGKKGGREDSLLNRGGRARGREEKSLEMILENKKKIERKKALVREKRLAYIERK